MKLDWENWNTGGKIIFISTCLAVMSMPMTWVDLGFVSRSGFSGSVILWLGLWIYPAMMLLQNKEIKRRWGLLCAIASLLLVLRFFSSMSVTVFGKTVSGTGSGAHLFLLASLALFVGVLKYQPLARAQVSVEAVKQ